MAFGTRRFLPAVPLMAVRSLSRLLPSAGSPPREDLVPTADLCRASMISSSPYPPSGGL